MKKIKSNLVKKTLKKQKKSLKKQKNYFLLVFLPIFLFGIVGGLEGKHKEIVKEIALTFIFLIKVV